MGFLSLPSDDAPPRPHRAASLGRDRSNPTGAGVAIRLGLALALILAVAIGFAASDGDGRVIELFVLGAGMILDADGG